MAKKKGNASKEAAELIAHFCDGYVTGEMMVGEAIRAVVDEEWQHLLLGRLRRQAWLLAQLYEHDYVSLWALAAAAALEEGAVVEHPLLRGMMDASFFTLLENSRYWMCI